MAAHHQASDLREQLVQSLAQEAPPAPADRDALRGNLIGYVQGICRGFSMASDASEAMRQICDKLIAYHNARAESLDAEDGPFAPTFAVYAEEARAEAEQMAIARRRWAQ